MRKTFLFLALGLLLTTLGAQAADKEIYSKLVDDGKTLLFVYDDQRSGVADSQHPTLYDPANNPGARFEGYNVNITAIHLDESMQDYKPLSLRYFFGGSKTTNSLYNVTQIRHLDYLNTSSCQTMECMFFGMNKLESVDLSKFNTANVQNMTKMFMYCQKLASINLSAFNTWKVTRMDWMFFDCRALTALDVTILNTSNVTNMNSMFQNCGNVKELNLLNFDMAKVTDATYMFAGCSSLVTILCGNDWSKLSLTSDGMFQSCNKLKGGKGTTFDSAKQDKTYARPDGGTSAPGYFTAPKKVYTEFVAATSTLTYYCDDLYPTREGAVEFYNPSNGDHFPIDYASKVEKIVVNASMADTALTYMSYLFSSRPLERRLVNVTDITGLENLNTSKTTSMSYMFAGLESLTVLDLTMLETPNLSAMDHMFYHCIALEKLDISSFNTSKVTSMRETFLDCLKLRAFNFTKADCSKVTDMTRLFAGNSGSTKPNAMVTIWCNADLTSKTASNCGDMFLNCQNIEGGKGTKYNASYIRNEYARPDGGPESETPGYFTPTSVLQAMIDEVVESLEALVTTPDATVQAIIDAEVADVQNYDWDLNSTLTFNQSGFDATFSEAWFLEVKGKVADAYQLSAAKKALSGIIAELQDLYNFAATYAEAKDIKFIQDQIDAAQAVVDNPAATLSQVNDAKTAAATALETDAGLILLVAQQEACKELEALLKPDDSDACKQIVANAKNVVINTTWDKTKTVKENIDIISKTFYDNYNLTIVALEEQREKDHPTAIDQILNTQLLDGKFIRNGQLFIQRGEEIFNAQGARVK